MKTLRTEDYYRRLLENMPGVACELAADGTILFANDRVREVTGYEPEELVGRNWWFTFFPGQLRPQVDDLHRQLQAGDVHGYEVAVKRADGSLATLECTTANTYSANGSLQSITMVAVDTSLLRQTQDAWQQAEMLREAILSNLKEVAVLFVAPDSVVEWSNEAAPSLLGVPGDSLVGSLCCWALEGAEESERCPTGLALRTGQTQEREVAAPSGRVFLLRSTPVEDGSGQPAGVIHTALDVTERKDAEAKVRRLTTDLDERIGQLASQLSNAIQDLDSFSDALSHDLRALLQGLQDLSQAVAREYGSSLPDQACDYLQQIQDNATRADLLIDDLLALARLCRQELAIAEINPGEIVCSVLNDLRRGLAGRNVLMLVHDLPSCQADPVLLRQLYFILLSDALESTRNCPEAVVEVGCRAEAGEDVYYVKNNGLDFDVVAQAQVVGATQPSGGANVYTGSGTRLAIAKRIIERHRGRIQVESVPDQGSTFYFTLHSPQS